MTISEQAGKLTEKIFSQNFEYDVLEREIQTAIDSATKEKDAEIERLKTALRIYGNHEERCHHGAGGCICGWEKQVERLCKGL